MTPFRGWTAPRRARLSFEDAGLLKHAAEKWKPLFGANSMLNFLESITFMRFDRPDQNAS
jgi:hypothetical protein